LEVGDQSIVRYKLKRPENAALPHGSGNDRRLGEEDFALFDIMGSLHGYSSDLTRVS
jgi:Xaa-Pro aminopeptidase